MAGALDNYAKIIDINSKPSTAETTAAKTKNTQEYVVQRLQKETALIPLPGREIYGREQDYEFDRTVVKERDALFRKADVAEQIDSYQQQYNTFERMILWFKRGCKKYKPDIPKKHSTKRKHLDQIINFQNKLIKTSYESRIVEGRIGSLRKEYISLSCFEEDSRERLCTLEEHLKIQTEQLDTCRYLAKKISNYAEETITPEDKSNLQTELEIIFQKKEIPNVHANQKVRNVYLSRLNKEAIILAVSIGQIQTKFKTEKKDKNKAALRRQKIKETAGKWTAVAEYKSRELEILRDKYSSMKDSLQDIEVIEQICTDLIDGENDIAEAFAVRLEKDVELDSLVEIIQEKTEYLEEQNQAVFDIPELDYDDNTPKLPPAQSQSLDQ